jgi:hypothetical protein
MARTIAPGQPTPIKPVEVDIPNIDLELFEKVGDNKIKNATQNFQLYATTTSNAEAQKLYEKYKNNPIALANALSKLPEMFKDLPQSVQDQIKPKMDSNAISLVTKAQANQEKAIAKQNKALAHANAVLGANQIADDYFNVLRYITSPEGEKRPVDLAIYRQHRAELERLAASTDEDGKPLFSESQIAKLLMPKDATVAGFKQFIARPELEELQEWDKDVFQNRTKFMEDTGIDADTYETMETALKQRLSALSDDKLRELHGQAYQDQMSLINEPTKLNIEKAKSYDFVNDKDIDNAVEASKKMTLAAWYDPMKPTNPAAFIMGINQFGEALQNNDWSPEGRERAVRQAYGALTQLERLAEETNMDQGTVRSITDSVWKALTDRQAQQAMINTGFGAMFDPDTGTTRNLREDLKERYGRGGSSLSDAEKIAMFVAKPKKDAEAAKIKANANYSQNLRRAVPYILNNDYQNYSEAVRNADKQWKMDAASYIVDNGFEWERLERELAEGKKPIYKWMGRTLEFKGFDNNGAVFDEVF